MLTLSVLAGSKFCNPLLVTGEKALKTRKRKNRISWCLTQDLSSKTSKTCRCTRCTGLSFVTCIMIIQMWECIMQARELEVTNDPFVEVDDRLTRKWSNMLANILGRIAFFMRSTIWEVRKCFENVWRGYTIFFWKSLFGGGMKMFWIFWKMTIKNLLILACNKGWRRILLSLTCPNYLIQF